MYTEQQKTKYTFFCGKNLYGTINHVTIYFACSTDRKSAINIRRFLLSIRLLKSNFSRTHNKTCRFTPIKKTKCVLSFAVQYINVQILMKAR